MKNRSKRVLCLTVLLCLMCAFASAETPFQSLSEQHGITNPDVIAWLEVPGASICEPVLRHPQDDAFYAKRGADGRANAYGALYVQAKYNAADFKDPVTLVYGSSAEETAPFGMLQEIFSGSFDQCRSLYVHTPESTKEYVVFASLPYSSIHILHYYDFHSERRYRNFFDSVFSTRALGMHLDEDKRPEAAEDQVLILSTGLRGDSLQRYLVMAKRVIR